MTSNLRKAHKIIWLMLLLIIPVVLVFAVLEIKKPAINDGDLVSLDTPSGAQTHDDEHIGMRIKENDLQLILKRPLKSPSAIVYGVLAEGSKEVFIGIIDKKGVYNFSLNDGINGLRIYDAIKKVDILNIEL